MSRTIELGTRCTGLRASGSAIRAACPVDGGDVRAGFAGGLARIKESVGVTAVADARPGMEGGLHATRTATWARAQGDFLRYVDVGTAEVTRRISAPEQSGGDALVAYGWLWVTAYDADVLYRIPLGGSASAAPAASASPTP